MFSEAFLEHIHRIATTMPKPRAMIAMREAFADLEFKLQLADQVKISSGKPPGQPIHPSAVSFAKRFTHTSDLNGQTFIAYDLIAGDLEAHHAEEDKINKAYARELNAGMADELKRLNGQA